MTIPEIAARLKAIGQDESLPELIELAQELRRRPPVRRAYPTSAPCTPQMRTAIREYAASYPQAKFAKIAAHFNVNPGRVSEALAGFRS